LPIDRQQGSSGKGSAKARVSAISRIRRGRRPLRLASSIHRIIDTVRESIPGAGVRETLV
jgi:hypothetical protein